MQFIELSCPNSLKVTLRQDMIVSCGNTNTRDKSFVTYLTGANVEYQSQSITLDITDAEYDRLSALLTTKEA